MIEPPFDATLVEIDTTGPAVRRTARRLGDVAVTDPVFAADEERWQWDGARWEAQPALERREHVFGVPDLTEHAREAAQRRAVVVLEERRRRVLDDDHVEAAIGSVARRRLDAHVGRHAGENERLDVHVAQQPFDPRRVERARGVLVDHELAGCRRQRCDHLVLERAAVPQRRRARRRQGVLVAAPAPRDHVAAVGEERPMPREHDGTRRRPEALEQAARVRDSGLRDTGHVVRRDLRVPLGQHLHQADVRVAPVVLHVDDDERGTLPVDLELGPRRVPAGEGLRRVDGRQIAQDRVDPR